MEIWTWGWIEMDLLPNSDRDISSNYKFPNCFINTHWNLNIHWITNVHWIWMDSDAHNSDQSLPAILFGPQWPPVYHQTFCDPMKYRFESNLEIHIIGAVENPHSEKMLMVLPLFNLYFHGQASISSRKSAYQHIN